MPCRRACRGRACSCLGIGGFLDADGGPHGCAFCLQLRRHLLYPPQQCDRRRRARSCRRRLTLLSLRGFPLVGSLVLLGPALICHPTVFLLVILLVILLVFQTQHVDF